MSVVQNPTAGDVHVNRPLTNFAQKYLQSSAAFIANKAFPNLPVSKQSDLYYTFDKDDFFRDDAEERGDGTESAGGGFTLSPDPYYCRVYAYHKDVTDRQRANQDDLIALDNSASQFVTQKGMIRRERVFAEKFLAESVWFNGGAAAAAAEATDWGNASSDPIGQIRDAITGVHKNTGYRPNKMTIGRTRYDQLLDNDEILSRITGGATTTVAAQVKKELLAQLFELEAIHVMDGVVNLGKKGAATQTKEFIGSDKTLLYYAPDSAGPEEPTAGAQFSWTGLHGNTEDGMRIKRFRMENLEADRIEGQMTFDFRVTAPELGHLFD